MKIDSEYFGKDWARSKEENIRIFKKRHKIGVWMVVYPMLAHVITAIFQHKINWLSHSQHFVFIIFFSFPVLFYVVVIYRCPKCGQTPYSSQNRAQGVLFFPKKCVRCKTHLLHDHPLGQK